MCPWSRLVFEKETLGIPGVHSVGQYNYASAKAGLPPHQHRGCVEISFLLKGHQTYRVKDKTYSVTGGEQYVSLPDEVHDTGDQPEDKGILYWLILDVTNNCDEFLFLSRLMARKLVADLLQFPTRHFVANPDSHAAIENVFKALLQIRTPDQCSGIFVKNACVNPSNFLQNGCALPSIVKIRKADHAPFDDSHHLLQAASSIVYYASQSIAASWTSSRSISPIIQASLAVIDQNHQRWLSVGQVADEIHLSESAFRNLFRQEVGMPPAEYMIRQKVELAKGLLRKPGSKITNVAHDLGFSSSQYFATVFRRFTDQSPSEFVKAGHIKPNPI